MAASIMQLVLSVKAPSSVWIQHTPVAGLNTRPSGADMSLSSVRFDRFTADLSAPASAPNT
ncbi:hypothetical protein Y695_04047 [Hydrogenophaga sp. T4]|nr:hypothetical protein Y695_04047 [Hydrogenophaga sp. T4]